MSYMIKNNKGHRTFVNGLAYPTNANLERIAKEIAERVDGVVYYENGLTNFQKNGKDMFPRWIPLGEDLPKKQLELEALYQKQKAIKQCLTS